MGVGIVALLSGLFGSLVTAALNYYVRWRLDERARREAEKRYAYIHVVKISEFIALEVVLKTLAKAFTSVLGEKLDQLKDKEGRFELTHGICARIAKEIQEVPEDDLKKLQDIRFIKGLAESLGEFKLTPDQLVTLPRDTILSYSFFQSYAAQLVQSLELWEDFVKTGNRRLIDAEILYSQWLSISHLVDSANSLRTALVIKGDISKAEATKILLEQVEHIKKAIAIGLSGREKIGKALEALEQEQQSHVQSIELEQIG